MISEQVDIKKDLIKTGIFVVIMFILYFISVLALTGGQGFESESFKEKFIMFTLFGLFGLAVIGISAIVSLLIGKRFLRVPLHEPEETFLGSYKTVSDPLLMLLGIILIFSIPLFFAGFSANTFFSSVPQQISTFSNLFSDSIFPAQNENLLMFIPIILLLTANYYYFKKNKYLFWFNNAVTIPLIMACIWAFVFHALVYGGDEISTLSTFIFGYVGVALTLITMSFIPWFVLHFLTNFMLSLKRYGLFSNDFFLVELIAVYLIIFAIFIWRLWVLKKKQ